MYVMTFIPTIPWSLLKSKIQVTNKFSRHMNQNKHDTIMTSHCLRMCSQYSQLRYLLWIPIWENVSAETMSQPWDCFWSQIWEPFMNTAPVLTLVIPCDVKSWTREKMCWDRGCQRGGSETGNIRNKSSSCSISSSDSYLASDNSCSTEMTIYIFSIQLTTAQHPTTADSLKWKKIE